MTPLLSFRACRGILESKDKILHFVLNDKPGFFVAEATLNDKPRFFVAEATLNDEGKADISL